MTTDPARDNPRIYRIDGRKVKTPKDFYREIGRSVNGPDGYFGNNLDALADCLRGGFGTPAGRDFEFEWNHSDLSRRRLRGVERGGVTFVDAVREVFLDTGITLHLR